MRPSLYYVQCRRVLCSGRCRSRWTRIYTGRSVEVRDLYEAIRHADYDSAEHGYGYGRALAGRTWLLTAGWTEGEARDRAKALAAGQHPRQLDFVSLHAEIRAGLDPDLSLLRRDDPPCLLRRRRSLKQLPLWSPKFDLSTTTP